MLLVLGLAGFDSGKAQEPGGLPALHPINPMAQARTSLYFAPYRPPQAGWRGSLSLDYGSVIEFGRQRRSREYLLDAEVAMVNLELGRDVGRNYFVQAGLDLSHAGPGFMDGFIDWYHHLFGFRMPERDLRPRNSFGSQLDIDGTTYQGAPGTSAGIRLSAGRRHSGSLQSVLTVRLPVAGRAIGDGGTPTSIGLLNTWRGQLSQRLLYEGSFNLGYTSTNGDLSSHQRTRLTAVSSGLRYRILGRQSLFVNAWYHSAYYRDTGYAALDRDELTINYGWILTTAGGTEWRVGMTEDLTPSGPAVDAVFQFGVSY